MYGEDNQNEPYFQISKSIEPTDTGTMEGTQMVSPLVNLFNIVIIPTMFTVAILSCRVHPE